MIAGAVMVALGAWMLWTARLAALGRLARSGTLGIRTDVTMASDAAWIAGHRAAAWTIAAVGLALILGGLWFVIAPPSRDRLRLVVPLGAIAVVAVAVIGVVQADAAANAVSP